MEVEWRLGGYHWDLSSEYLGDPDHLLRDFEHCLEIFIFSLNPKFEGFV